MGNGIFYLKFYYKRELVPGVTVGDVSILDPTVTWPYVCATTQPKVAIADIGFFMAIRFVYGLSICNSVFRNDFMTKDSSSDPRIPN